MRRAAAGWSVWFGDRFGFSGDKANDFPAVLKFGIELDCHGVVEDPSHLLLVTVFVSLRWLSPETSGNILQRIRGEMPDLVVNAVCWLSSNLAVVCGYDENGHAPGV